MDSETAKELTAGVLANLRAIKQNWPQVRRSDLSVLKDTETPIPELAYRRRIQGRGADDDPTGRRFIEGGIEDAQVVINLAEVYGVQFRSGTRVLDWGVGCARICRHLPAVLRERFVGADVDPINIEWCQKNMRWGRYQLIVHDKPAPFQNASFDYIYSHSVFSHLSESDQNFSLEELVRICDPRGLMVLSLHSLHSTGLIADWARDPVLLARWLTKGFIDPLEANRDIEDVVPKEYYRDVAHTATYIREHWSRFVDVIDMIPGGFDNVQDVVVCRPRGAGL